MMLRHQLPEIVVPTYMFGFARASHHGSPLAAVDSVLIGPSKASGAGEGDEVGDADLCTRYGTLTRVKRHDASARVALLAFLAVGLATAWLVPLPHVHTSPGGVVMPDVIAGFSRFQRSAEGSPPGPTLLTFESGALADSAASESQQVLMGVWLSVSIGAVASSPRSTSASIRSTASRSRRAARA